MGVRRTLTVLVLLAFCFWAYGAQNVKPVIWAQSPIVVGRQKTVTCTYTAQPAPANVSALSFLIEGGQILNNPTVSTISPSSTLREYKLAFNISISADYNEKVFKCRTWDGRESSYTMYVTTPPRTVVINGPTSIVGNSTETWTCVVDGGSSHASKVTWKYNTNTITGATNTDNSYRDSNNIFILKTTSTLTKFTPPGTRNFDLTCEAYHLPTSVIKKSVITVNVKNLFVSTSTESSQDITVTVNYLFVSTSTESSQDITVTVNSEDSNRDNNTSGVMGSTGVLSTSAILGIIFGLLLLLGLVLTIIEFTIRRKKKAAVKVTDGTKEERLHVMETNEALEVLKIESTASVTDTSTADESDSDQSSSTDYVKTMGK